MRRTNDLAVLIERWFTDRLMKHRGVSSNTIASYATPSGSCLSSHRRALGDPHRS